jgi:hypothetical protein
MDIQQILKQLDSAFAANTSYGAFKCKFSVNRILLTVF